MGVTAHALVRITDNIQAMAQAEGGWQLLDRLERLVLTLDGVRKTTDQYPKLKSPFERHRAAFEEALEALANDIDRAKVENRLVAFLNGVDEIISLDVHMQKLDAIIKELTAFICTTFHMSEEQLEQTFSRKTDHIQLDKRCSLESAEPLGVTSVMTNNKFGTVRGNVGMGNVIFGGGGMILEMHGNTFGDVTGSMFCNNVIG